MVGERRVRYYRGIALRHMTASAIIARFTSLERQAATPIGVTSETSLAIIRHCLFGLDMRMGIVARHAAQLAGTRRETAARSHGGVVFQQVPAGVRRPNLKDRQSVSEPCTGAEVCEVLARL